MRVWIIMNQYACANMTRKYVITTDLSNRKWRFVVAVLVAVARSWSIVSVLLLIAVFLFILNAVVTYSNRA